MEGTEIDLIQMLDCRERRGFIQNELLGKYHCPVISFCMNIRRSGRPFLRAWLR